MLSSFFDAVNSIFGTSLSAGGDAVVDFLAVIVLGLVFIGIPLYFFIRFLGGIFL